MMLKTVPSESLRGGRGRGDCHVRVRILPPCYRVYCAPCIEKLCGASEVERVSGICTNLLACVSLTSIESCHTTYYSMCVYETYT